MAMTRRYPMAKPEGFKPAVQRYSAVMEPKVDRFQVLSFGIQTAPDDDASLTDFLDQVSVLLDRDDGPAHHDFASFVDERGAMNCFTTAYWPDRRTYEAWAASTAVRDWWSDPNKRSGDCGYFWEPLPAAVELLETIAFKEYLRGLSACPMSSVEPMSESGYWGAARDRIPGSATDRLDAPDHTLSPVEQTVPTAGNHMVVQPPDRYVLIRSGVSWEDCGPEQLASYEENVRPKLDAGMEFLRTNPVEAGCWSLRQVDVITADGAPTKETYVAGHFLSLAHLERWAHNHPTHLAIYGQAQKERVKYQDSLELRTYHEVYVVDEPASFEYINCHDTTGALGLFPAEVVSS